MLTMRGTRLRKEEGRDREMRPEKMMSPRGSATGRSWGMCLVVRVVEQRDAERSGTRGFLSQERDMEKEKGKGTRNTAKETERTKGHN